MHREPDVGPDPGSPGSRPGPKAGAKPLHHPGIPMLDFLTMNPLYLYTLENMKVFQVLLDKFAPKTKKIWECLAWLNQ